MALKLDFKNPKLRHPLIISAVGIAGIALWYNMMYVDKNQIYVNAKSDLFAKQKELNSILALKPQLKRIQKEIDSAQNRLDSLKSIFPDRKEIPKLLREITGGARASGILTTKFNPRPDVEKEYYVENHYDLSVTGGFHDLARFYCFLANMPLIINLSKVTIKTNPRIEESKKLSEEHGSAVSTVISSFTMTTFSSKK
jgi:type IV pilus assembly protein PilO